MTQELEAEIDKKRLEISADSVSMSITELSNLYREGILVIRPEFQRLFRWSSEQKSRLVESILLGIPLPSLFVSQSQDGKWELVDGLQRVSTILQLQGLLPGLKGTSPQPFVLQATKFLPHLENHSWTGHGNTTALTEAQKLDIRLSRLDIRVIKRSSDPKAKYDLFQRLNSFGSALTAQEIRSAMMAGLNHSALEWTTKLTKDPAFTSCVTLNDRQREEQYDIELVLRFLMLHQLSDVTRSKLADFPAKLDDWAADLAADFDALAPALEAVFTRTFEYLAAAGNENLFRRWDDSLMQFRGGFLNTAYEVIAMGAGYCMAQGEKPRLDPEEAARQLSRALSKSSRFATGLATADRLVKTIPLGRKLMRQPSEPILPGDL